MKAMSQCDEESIEKIKKLFEESINANDIKKVKFFINQGVSVNITFESGFTPLILAISLRSNELAKYLIDHGADLNYICFENPPLYTALHYRNQEIAKYLIQKGADVNMIYDNKTPLYVALYTSSIEVCKCLLENGADPKISRADGSPLELAIFRNYDEVTKLIIDKIMNSNDTRSNKKFLRYAIQCNKNEIIYYYLSKDPNLPKVWDKEDLVHLALLYENIKVVEYLITKGKVNLNKLHNGKTLLHKAINNFKDIAKVLIDYGADVNSLNNKQTFLIIAHHRKLHSWLIEYLLIAGFDVNMEDEYKKVIGEYVGEKHFSTKYHAFTFHEHIIKLIAANFSVDSRNKKAAYLTYKNYASLYRQSVEEINHMKQLLINPDGNVTYYDLLYKNIHKLALKFKNLYKSFLNNKNVSINLQYLRKFNHYKNMLKFRLNKVLKRAEFLVKVEEFIVEFARRLLLDPEIIRESLEYFSNADLRLLCDK